MQCQAIHMVFEYANSAIVSKLVSFSVTMKHIHLHKFSLGACKVILLPGLLIVPP